MKKRKIKILGLDSYGRLFVSKLWHDIRAFFPTYTCNHSCYTIYVRFFATYTCLLPCLVGFLFPSIWPFSYKQAYICAQKSPYICVTNKHVYNGVTDSRRIRDSTNFSTAAAHPLTFYIPFSRFRIPSIDKWYSFHITCLELCTPFNCWKPALS